MTADLAIKPVLSRVPQMSIFMGCDPEFFFKVSNKVVGAEFFLPREGFKPDIKKHTKFPFTSTFKSGTEATVVIDGVQAELNPRPNTCRANLANEIAVCMRALKEQMDKTEGSEASFAQTVSISEAELSKMDEKNKKFGCDPSFNSYNGGASAKLSSVDASKYRVRSAGGHIHLGFTGNQLEKVRAEKDTLVKLLDIICGNTCVLVDRDVGNKIRRRLYGRAGEYRLPPHGLEYRTLSNFWLQSYPLMSLAFGLARSAVEVFFADAAAKAFIEASNLEDTQKAINENDFDLAMKNFEKIEGLISQVFYNDTHFPVNQGTLKPFKHFVNKIKSDGLSYWFKDDPMMHWTSLPEAHSNGFYDFANRTIALDMK